MFKDEYNRTMTIKIFVHKTLRPKYIRSISKLRMTASITSDWQFILFSDNDLISNSEQVLAESVRFPFCLAMSVKIMLDCSILSWVANKIDALSNLSFNFSIVSRLHSWRPWDYTGGKLQGMENLQRTFDGDVAAIVAKVLSIEKHNRGLFAEQAHVSLPLYLREETRVLRSSAVSHSRAEGWQKWNKNRIVGRNRINRPDADSSARTSEASAAVFGDTAEWAELSRGAQRTIVVALLTHIHSVKFACIAVYMYDS